MSTIAIAVPAVNPVPKIRFAVRRFIKVVAVECECGKISHGPGVRKWKQCPRCVAPIISSKEQRYRDTHPYLDADQQIYDRNRSEVAVLPL